MNERGSCYLTTIEAKATTDFQVGEIIASAIIVPNTVERLGQLASAYQRIRYNKLGFKFYGQFSEFSAGGLAAAFVRDPSDAPEFIGPDASQQMMRWISDHAVKMTMKWSKQGYLHVPFDPDLLYTSPSKEVRLYSPGSLWIISDGSPGQLGTVKIEFDYDVTLMEPSLEVRVEDEPPMISAPLDMWLTPLFGTARDKTRAILGIPDSFGSPAGDPQWTMDASFVDLDPWIPEEIMDLPDGVKFQLPRPVPLVGYRDDSGANYFPINMYIYYVQLESNVNYIQHGGGAVAPVHKTAARALVAMMNLPYVGGSNVPLGTYQPKTQAGGSADYYYLTAPIGPAMLEGELLLPLPEEHFYTFASHQEWREGKSITVYDRNRRVLKKREPGTRESLIARLRDAQYIDKGLLGRPKTLAEQFSSMGIDIDQNKRLQRQLGMTRSAAERFAAPEMTTMDAVMDQLRENFIIDPPSDLAQVLKDNKRCTCIGCCALRMGACNDNSRLPVVNPLPTSGEPSSSSGPETAIVNAQGNC